MTESGQGGKGNSGGGSGGSGKGSGGGKARAPRSGGKGQARSGPRPGSKPGSRTGPKASSRPGSRRSTDPQGNSGSRSASRSEGRPGARPGARPGSKPGRGPGPRPARSADSRPGRKRAGGYQPPVDAIEPLYLQTGTYFAQIAGGLEKLGARELENLGATEINIINRGLDFKADRETLYRICYCSRLVTRILAPVHRFRAENPEALYLETKRIDWTNIFKLDQTFAVFANVSHSNIDHSQFAALKVKDSVVDMFRKRYRQKRPNVDPADPDLWIALHIHDNEATLSIDCSGGSLHKRGYRQQQVEAPIQETLAAAILEISGWDGKKKLYDPMCGSGTLLSEAWMRAAGLPAQVLRKKFGFMMLPDYDRRVWVKVKLGEEKNQRLVRGGLIRGSDIDPAAVRMTRRNNARLPGGDELIVKTIDFRDLPPMDEGTLILCNPPYGVRLMADEDMAAFYKDFGDFLKNKCKGCQAFVYFGDRELIGNIGLKTSMKMPLRNGGLDGRLVWYELY